MPGENIEDELSAINHPRIDDFFDIALLRGGEIVIKEQEICRH